MLTVDRFMDMNGRQLSYMTRTEYAPNPIRWSRFHVPAMTFEEAADFCGYSEEDIDPTFSISLPVCAQDRYALRKRVYGKMISDPGRVTIISECIHNVPGKVRHHPSYDDPFSVVRLCKKCHSQEHARMAKRDKETLILMIAVKMFSTRRNVAVSPPSADSLRAVTLLDRGAICSTPILDPLTGGIEDEPAPFEVDMDDSDIPHSIVGSCTSFGTRGVQYQQLSLF